MNKYITLVVALLTVLLISSFAVMHVIKKTIRNQNPGYGSNAKVELFGVRFFRWYKPVIQFNIQYDSTINAMGSGFGDFDIFKWESEIMLCG